jgi:hypothetical protein
MKDTILSAIQSSKNILINTITSYLDLILHHNLQNSPFGCAHTDRRVPATFEMHPGSVSLFFVRSIVCVSTWLSSMYQIFALSNWLLSWGRERSRMELSLASEVGREQLPFCFQPKIPAQYKLYAAALYHGHPVVRAPLLWTFSPMSSLKCLRTSQ